MDCTYSGRNTLGKTLIFCSDEFIRQGENTIQLNFLKI